MIYSFFPKGETFWVVFNFELGDEKVGRSIVWFDSKQAANDYARGQKLDPRALKLSRPYKIRFDDSKRAKLKLTRGDDA